jgi:hypothetical protein
MKNVIVAIDAVLFSIMVLGLIALVAGDAHLIFSDANSDKFVLIQFSGFGIVGALMLVWVQVNQRARKIRFARQDAALFSAPM